MTLWGHTTPACTRVCFAHAGHSAPQIKAKLDAAWNQLFHGNPGTEPTREDGQALYYQLTSDMAMSRTSATRTSAPRAWV